MGEGIIFSIYSQGGGSPMSSKVEAPCPSISLLYIGRVVAPIPISLKLDAPITIPFKVEVTIVSLLYNILTSVVMGFST